MSIGLCVLLGLLCACRLKAESPLPGSTEGATSSAFGHVLDGRLNEAESAARRALTGREAELGSLHPLTALARRNLGLALWHLGKYEEAEQEILEAKALLRRIEGKAGTNCLRLSLDLAGLWLEQGRYAEAGLLYQESWKLTGDAALRLESSLAGIPALARGGLGKRALNFAAAARAEAAAGGKLAEWQLAEAETLLRLGRIKQALAGYEKARDLLQARHGAADHPFLTLAWEGLAACHEDLGQLRPAAALLEKALQARRRMAGLLSYASLPQHEAVGRILLKLGRNQEALAVLSQALELRQSLQVRDHPACADLRAIIEKLRINPKQR